MYPLFLCVLLLLQVEKSPHQYPPIKNHRAIMWECVLYLKWLVKSWFFSVAITRESLWFSEPGSSACSKYYSSHETKTPFFSLSWLGNLFQPKVSLFPSPPYSISPPPSLYPGSIRGEIFPSFFFLSFFFAALVMINTEPGDECETKGWQLQFH